MAKYRMYKDPGQFGAKYVKKPEGAIRCLGLDLGSNCGAALYDYVPQEGAKLIRDKLQLSQWDLSVNGLDSGASRYVRLRAFLNAIKPDAIAFEDVKYTPPKEFFVNKKFGIPMVLARTAKAAEVLGGMKVTVATWAEERNLPCMGYGIMTIKKFATGNGKSNKEDMINAANKLLGTAFDPEKYKSAGIDNVVDAAFVLIMLVTEMQKSVPRPSK